ncbi:SDR family oxidoreductase [Noviherbaspirillum saxi]|uniref:SDR family oxidoreductase n=1 Tax=Noviherbaspirillum saxi TaxID=2320863 RepID=A0A3A3FIE9_9BURK|nr:SDR family oxidoreductase [Noviherbaspirillum saxi]
MALQADVTDSAAIRVLIEKTVARFGRIDVLINNAGHMVGRRATTEITDEFFDQVAYLNMRSVIVVCKEVVSYMHRQGGGSAVLYAASKGFVTGYIDAARPGNDGNPFL